MYTVYKITNIINGKTYIGVHKTQNPNDSYMGSGIAIVSAIRKYGKQNFIKDILLTTESKETAYALEYQLTENFEGRENYNKRRGGVGGFTKDESHKGYEKVKSFIHVIGGKAAIRKMSREDRLRGAKAGGKANKGIKRTEKDKQHLRDYWTPERRSELGRKISEAKMKKKIGL